MIKYLFNKNFRLVKLFLTLTILITMVGCSNMSSEEKQLNDLFSSVSLDEMSNNDELNEIYFQVINISSDSKSFIKLKNEIINKMEDRAISIWENAIVNAIKTENYKNYFNYRESIAYKDYYYWRLATGNYIGYISPFDYDTNDGTYEHESGYVFADDDLCLKSTTINNTFIGANVADIRYMQIYYLEVYRSYMWNWGKYDISDLEGAFLSLAQYDILKINPSYSGLMSDEIHSLGIQLFGSVEEWEKQYENAIFKGLTPYFMSREDIEKEWQNRYTEEEISSAQKREDEAYELSQAWKEYFEQLNKEKEELAKSKPKVGMTEKEVLQCRWGKPDHVNTTETKYGTYEQWCYPGNRYVYLENGIVTSVSY